MTNIYQVDWGAVKMHSNIPSAYNVKPTFLGYKQEKPLTLHLFWSIDKIKSHIVNNFNFLI